MLRHFMERNFARRPMSYPEETLRLAGTLLGQFELDQTVMILRHQGSLFGGCCGNLTPNPEYSAALFRLADMLEPCSDKSAAAAKLAALRSES